MYSGFDPEKPEYETRNETCNLWVIYKQFNVISSTKMTSNVREDTNYLVVIHSLITDTKRIVPFYTRQSLSLF